MKKELEKKVYELNLALNNPVVPWTPEKGPLDRCLVLDYFQPGDSKTPYRLQISVGGKGGLRNVTDKMSAKDMSAFLKGALYAAKFTADLKEI